MATTSAFVVWVPKVTPLPDPAWTKQASSSLGGPLGDDGDKMGADHAFSWVRRRSTCPLHVFKGVEVRVYYRCIAMCSLQTPDVVFRVQENRTQGTWKHFVWKYKDGLGINMNNKRVPILKDINTCPSSPIAWYLRMS